MCNFFIQLAIVSKLYVCFEKQGLKKEAQAVILIHVVKQLQYNAPQDQYLRHCWSSLQNEEQSKVLGTFCTDIQFLIL